MAITPNSSIHFCNVPWGSDYTHVCDASNLSTTLTGTPLVKTVSDYTYIRKDSIINVSVPIDELIGANYVMYKNTNHENKWFYAFILEMNYLSDLSTMVKIKTDVYQTWRNDMTIPACFIDREHANTDIAGDNVVDEGLETGEYIKNSTDTIAALNDLAFIVGISAYDTDLPDTHTIAGRIYNGIYSGLVYVPFYGSGAAGALQSFIEDYATAGRNDAIHVIFTFPSALLPSGTVSGSPMHSTDCLFIVLPESVPASATNGIISTATSRTVTTGVDGILYIGVRISGTGIIPDEPDFTGGTYWAQLEEGDTATPYVPY